MFGKKIEVREYEENNYRNLLKIYLENNPQFNENFFEGQLNRYKKHHEIFVSYLDQKIIGFVFYKFKDNESNFIGQFQIKKDFQGKGYGKNLVNFLVHDCYECGKKNLYCNITQDNLNAIKFYSGLGFQHVGFSEESNEVLIYKLDVNEYKRRNL